MKRTLTFFLSLAVSLMALQASAAMYIVGDAPFGNWNPAGGVAMSGNADGTYSYTATISGKVYFVFGTALASTNNDAGWNTFNTNYRYVLDAEAVEVFLHLQFAVVSDSHGVPMGCSQFDVHVWGWSVKTIGEGHPLSVAGRLVCVVTGLGRIIAFTDIQ